MMLVNRFFATVSLIAATAMLPLTTHAHEGQYGSGTHEHFGTDDQLEFPNGTVYMVMPVEGGGSITAIVPAVGKGQGAICQTDGEAAGGYPVDKKRCKELLEEAVDSGDPVRPGEKPPTDSKPAEAKPSKPVKAKKLTKQSGSGINVVLIRKGEKKFQLKRLK